MIGRAEVSLGTDKGDIAGLMTVLEVGGVFLLRQLAEVVVAAAIFCKLKTGAMFELVCAVPNIILLDATDTFLEPVTLPRVVVRSSKGNRVEE